MIKDKVILGIDPGTNIMGYGIIHILENKPNLISLGILNLSKYDDHYVKLHMIYTRTTGLIDEYHPDELAIEAPFYGKNVQSMLKLGRAQGAAIAAVLSRSMPIFEYAPRKIKLSITGSGSASKEQVASMLERIFNISDMPKKMDATDGLAVALCHFYQISSPVFKKSGSNNWKDFINKNPDRIG
ncbi:MAG: crossover junction endodeoxyribonuclease RuvC [Bacteroidota bacterium]